MKRLLPMAIAILLCVPMLFTFPSRSIDQWSIEIINKDSPADYPTSIDEEEIVEIVVEVRATVPTGETGRVNITVDSRFWVDPMPLRLVWLSPEYQEESLECSEGITTHEFTFDFSAPAVIRECFGSLHISADLLGGNDAKDFDFHTLDYKIVPVDDIAVDVRFRGIIEDVNIFWDLFPIGADVNITDILQNPDSLLTVDTCLYVHDDTTILEDMNITVGDRVEVHCDYHPSTSALIWQPYHYVSREGSHDVNYDGVVNIQDISIAAIAFGSSRGGDRWNTVADVNLDDLVSIVDITNIAKDFGRSFT